MEEDRIRIPHLVGVVAWLALLASACAPTVPTPDPAEVQATAEAAAGTMVALTRAAVPTATSLPPSPAPSSTPTASLAPSPEPPAASTSSPTQAGAVNTGADPCKGPMSASPAGPLTTFKVVNSTRAPVTVSLGLTAKTAFGECGYRSYSLGPMDSVYLTDLPQGCYWAFAFVNDPKKPSQASNSGAMCANNDDKWTIVVQAEVIKFYSP